MKNILITTFIGILLLMTSCQKEIIEPASDINNQTNTENPNIPPSNNLPSDSPGTIKSLTTTNNPPSNLNLLQYLKGENDCTIFYQALFRTGINLDLSGDGPFTIFVPNDVAFQAFLANNNWTSLDDVSQNILTMIVKFHVANVDVKISELEVGTTVPLFLSGKELFINVDDLANPFLVLGLTKADFVARDLVHSNGVVHKINGVLAL
ncbi:MAG: fasciclin domain-containing protein [Saprospiraceae bacterium]